MRQHHTGPCWHGHHRESRGLAKALQDAGTASEGQLLRARLGMSRGEIAGPLTKSVEALDEPLHYDLQFGCLEDWNLSCNLSFLFQLGSCRSARSLSGRPVL